MNTEQNALYMAEEHSIIKMDLYSLETEEFANLKVYTMIYFGCELYYLDR